MFASLRLLFVLLLLGVPAGLVGIPWSLIVRNVRMMYGWAIRIERMAIRAASIEVSRVGLDNIRPGKQYIFLSNHTSNLDPPILMPAIPGQVSAFVKRELMKVPLLGLGMRIGKFIPVARVGSREEAQESVRAATDALRSGLHIMMFPEGTRSPDGSLQPFKKGAFFLAEETGTPIIPVIIRGTGQMMPRGTLRITPGRAVVRFLPPFHPQDFATREEMMEAVWSAMESELRRS